MQLVIHGFGANLVLTNDLEIDISQNSSPEPLMNKMIALMLSMKQEVYETNDNLPIVGTRAVRLGETDHQVEGFMHDRRRWESQDDDSTRQTSTLYNGNRSVVEGTLNKHWQSGIAAGDDCKYLDLYKEDSCTWRPVVLHGDYYVNWKPHYLWSEQSIIVPQEDMPNDLRGNPENTEPVTLTYRKKPGVPIHATIFRRNGDLAAERFLHADFVTEFTGDVNLDTRERDDVEPTDDVGSPFDLQDMERFNNYEILYREVNGVPYAFLNQPMFYAVGEMDAWELSNGMNFPTTDTTALQRVAASMENLGLGGDDESNQAYFTRFFPLFNQGIGQGIPIIVTTDGITATQWALATDNNLANHNSAEYVYEVDWDYGIIKFARNSPDATLFLDEAISASADTLLVDDATLMPESGRVQIGSEQIQYMTKDNNILGGLIRGVNGTTAAAYVRGSSITSLQCGRHVHVNELVSISYVASPRVEYEPEFFVDYLIANDTNVHPLANPSSNGIVYIGRDPLEIDDLVLTVNKNALGNGVFGPLAVGSDSAILTATAYTLVDTPIPGLTITIDQLDDPFVGLLNGAPTEYTSVSNQDGEVNASFTLGNNVSLVGAYAESATSGSGQSSITVDGDYSNQDLSEVLLFAVTKDDPAQGTVGVWADASAYAATTVFHGVQSSVTIGNIIVDATDPTNVSSLPLATRYPDGTFDGGMIYVTDGSSAVHEAVVVYWRNGHAFLDRTLTLSGGADYVRLIADDWEVWDSTELNGRKKVIYEYSPTAIHPVTGNTGAYFPVQPTSLSVAGGKTTFVFDVEVPVPDDADPEQNLGAYWLSLDAELSFQAYTDSILTGRRVTSNTVKLRISLPDYLKGVALENSSQVPYGFKFTSTSSSSSSGLDGSTFVTINPISGSYLAMSNPFASISFLLNVS